jgi:hypothetical protein
MGLVRTRGWEFEQAPLVVYPHTSEEDDTDVVASLFW